MGSVLHTSSSIKLRERKSTTRWKGTISVAVPSWKTMLIPKHKNLEGVEAKR